jgi:aminoglycoside phosphotransferase (APT) family kinase protein
MPEMVESSGGDRLAAVRAYAAEVTGRPPEAVTSVARFEDGDRHGVYRVSYRDGSEADRDVVVRVLLGADVSDLAQAEREAVVLESVGGVAAPKLYDFRRTSEWFDTPAMCMQFIPGRRLDARDVDPAQIEHLGSLLAWVHDRPVDALGDSADAAATVASYADARLRKILSALEWARAPLPRTLRDRLRHAADALAASGFDSDEGLALLHGDLGPGNVLWNPGPCLIDWEYTRLGDPADEIAYTFDQNAFTASRRQAFWEGYRQGLRDGSRLAPIVERADWWEPVTLLGSALWWAERWVRRTGLDAEGACDPALPREPDYYLGHVTARADRLDALAGRR